MSGDWLGRSLRDARSDVAAVRAHSTGDGHVCRTQRRGERVQRLISRVLDGHSLGVRHRGTVDVWRVVSGCAVVWKLWGATVVVVAIVQCRSCSCTAHSM